MGKSTGTGYRVEPQPATTSALNTRPDAIPRVEVVDVRCSAQQDRLAEAIGLAINEKEAAGFRHYSTIAAGADRFLLLFRRT